MSAPPRPGNIDMMAASLAATIQTGVSPVGPPPSLTKPEPPDEPPAPGAPPEPTAPPQAAAPRSKPQLPPGMGFPAIHAEPRVALPQVPPMQQHAPAPGQTAGPHAPPQGPPQPPQPPAQPPPEHPTPTPPVPAPDPPAAAEPISPEEKKSLASGSSSRKPKGQGGVSRNGPAWSEQEDAQIMQLVSVHGRKWKIIAESIPNRTHDALRNRYERLLKLTENGGSRANGHAASESADGKQHIPPGAANFVPASADMNQVLAIECIIPDAHREAQPLCWPSPSGVLVEVSVPPGARPGQTLRFHIPSWLAADLGHKVGPHPSQPPATGRVSPGASAPRKRPHDEVAPPVPMPPAGSMPPQGMPQPAALLAGAGPAGAGALGGAPPGALDAMMDASGPMDPMGMGDQLASSAAGAGPLGLAAGAGSASGLSDADGQGSCYPGEPPSSLAPMGADEDEDAPPLPGTESLMEMEMEAHHEPGPAGE